MAIRNNRIVTIRAILRNEYVFVTFERSQSSSIPLNHTYRVRNRSFVMKLLNASINKVIYRENREYGDAVYMYTPETSGFGWVLDI